MRIIVDAFGGDNAPLEVLKGCEMAVKEYGDLQVLLTGDKEEILKCAKEHQISLDRMEIHHTESVIPVCEEPTKILKEYRDSSMGAGLELVAKGEGDAFLSAGSTGAVVVGATLIVKRIKGVKRAAIGTVIPCLGGHYMLMDAGANADCRPEMLVQFGVMGSAYMEKIMKVKNPKVGLINIGAEDSKGTDLQQQANKQLRVAPINFTGNVEARDVPLGKCDVAVCDGFTGNVVLKLTEGLASFLGKEIKSMLLSSFKTKIAALMIKNNFSEFKKKLDYSEAGGAPLMGICKPVIKAHGSSDAKAFKNAIRQARACVDEQVIETITQTLHQMKEEQKLKK